MTSTEELQTEYAEWLARLQATYQSVAFCCWHRLGDRELADEVSAQVVAGLVRKPTVFKYFGLPFSGRIARLAEAGIQEARDGTLVSGRGWNDLIGRVQEAPPQHREFLVFGCLRDYDDAQLAAALDCDVEAAAERRSESLRFWEALASSSQEPVG